MRLSLYPQRLITPLERAISLNSATENVTLSSFKHAALGQRSKHTTTKLPSFYVRSNFILYLNIYTNLVSHFLHAHRPADESQFGRREISVGSETEPAPRRTQLCLTMSTAWRLHLCNKSTFLYLLLLAVQLTLDLK